MGGDVLDVDWAGVHGVQDGSLLAQWPGLKSGTETPNRTMRLYMSTACILTRRVCFMRGRSGSVGEQRGEGRMRALLESKY